ncbi:MAG: 50S ribosomal protein L11 methyltransferase [Caldilineaceae bacterium]|nr:50S ribosomal protein L11 methyltransferase [Caldilineaceae bacterium]
MDELLELAVVVDAESVEAVSELFNRYNGGDYDDDNEAGEAGGGGAVIEGTGFELSEALQVPLETAQRFTVKTYIKPGVRGDRIRTQIEEGLWRLSLLRPIPEPTVRAIREEDWAHAWKQFYKPLRVGRRVVLKPHWEDFDARPDDIVIELDPGMAFGTGLHPSTRLCIAALEARVRPGDAVLDVGTGSGVLSVVAARLGAGPILATDIDPLAVKSAAENAALNGLAPEQITIRQESVPAGQSGRFQIVVANILAEVLVKLFDGAYDNTPLAEPVTPDGVLILAGILDDRAHLVRGAGERHGFAVIETLSEEDWVALVMQRREA